MESLATATADSSSTEPANHLRLGALEVNHPVQTQLKLPQQLRKRRGLFEIPGVPIQEPTTGGIGLGNPVLNELQHHRIGDQLAGVHEGFGFETGFGPLLERFPQECACRDMRDREIISEPGGLRTFSDTRRTKENQTHPLVALHPYS